MVIEIYDFDKTIYNGDSTIDFYLYCLRQKPSLIKYLPIQLWHIFMYALGQENKTQTKSGFLIFLRDVKRLEMYVQGFWRKNQEKIMSWYQAMDHTNAVIISASPIFLLMPLAAKLETETIIATKVDTRTGKIEGKNCQGAEKVRRLLDEIENPEVAEAYTDSLSDMPILDLAKRKYIVKRQKVISLEAYQNLSLFQRLLP